MITFQEVEEEDDEQEQLSLDAAVRSYEKAAGLLSHLLKEIDHLLLCDPMRPQRLS